MTPLRFIVARFVLLLFLSLIVASAAHAERTLADPWKTKAGLGATEEEKEGAKVYASCASCHMADGSGRPDGSIPRLAGQPAPMLEQKLNVIRNFESFLPVMIAFARSLSPAEVTAVSAYMAALPEPAQIGTGKGDNLVEGRTTYETYCAGCHGMDALGLEATKAPRLCGQHYGYILRRIGEIGKGVRLRSNHGMAAIAGGLEPGKIEAVADYLSRGACGTEEEEP